MKTQIGRRSSEEQREQDRIVGFQYPTAVIVIAPCRLRFLRHVTNDYVNNAEQAPELTFDHRCQIRALPHPHLGIGPHVRIEPGGLADDPVTLRLEHAVLPAKNVCQAPPPASSSQA